MSPFSLERWAQSHELCSLKTPVMVSLGLSNGFLWFKQLLIHMSFFHEYRTWLFMWKDSHVAP